MTGDRGRWRLPAGENDPDGREPGMTPSLEHPHCSLSGASKLSGFVAHDLSGIIPYQGGAE
ncbi:MAG: hypothetical protein COX17_02190 [Deltaproteobacteria bacterium CG23_combo_of_CG06-09_8_20_14_all_60_8]|nr:MAG: hypothetical protein COX17_02190 [Deltaproteobacteria bacterium CG23_combo_of_CG06-09_8_20_14_all_60_8]